MINLKVLYHRILQIRHLGAVESRDSLLFVGFMLTIIYTVPENILGTVWISLPCGQTVSLSTLIWLAGVNLYLSALFVNTYLLTQKVHYLFIAGCYVIAIPEAVFFWDMAWFRLLEVPFTCNTFIFIAFVYGFYNSRVTDLARSN